MGAKSYPGSLCKCTVASGLQAGRLGSCFKPARTSVRTKKTMLMGGRVQYHIASSHWCVYIDVMKAHDTYITEQPWPVCPALYVLPYHPSPLVYSDVSE